MSQTNPTECVLCNQVKQMTEEYEDESGQYWHSPSHLGSAEVLY